jgi:hypothetical protein
MRLGHRPKPKPAADTGSRTTSTFNSMREYLARSRARRALLALLDSPAENETAVAEAAEGEHQPPAAG